MRLVVYYCINGDNTLLDDKLEAQEVVIVANKTRMSQSEFENAVGWDCLKQSYAKIDRILLEFGGCSYKVRCKHKFMNIRKWDDSTNKCVEEGTELVSCGDKKGFIAVPTCRKHKAVADRWIAANSDTEMSARIMRGQMNEEGQKSSAIAADMANIDALAQIKKNWLETGKSEQEFNGMISHLEGKMLGMYPNLPVGLMRQSAATWICLMLQMKLEKVTHLSLSLTERLIIKCLFCEKWPRHVQGYADRTNPRSVFYFVCDQHYLGRPNIKKAVLVHLIYLFALGVPAYRIR